MYEVLLFWFYVKYFQIMGTRCSLFFVTFIFCPLHQDIVKILMERQNSYNLQLGLFFGGCMYQILLFWFYVKLFQIMGTRCSLFFVTFILFPLH